MTEEVKRHTKTNDNECNHPRQELRSGRYDEFNFWYQCMDCQEVLRWYPLDADEQWMTDMRNRVY